ncbi:divergent polysaccharide deacetylase family protein [Ruegeria sp.]|uniref:divergent polysaccharide deacetylase family protein n=1 Tax=Ruegeria sp. TaxID=1879320 RepID=UPI003B5A8FFB
MSGFVSGMIVGTGVVLGLGAALSLTLPLNSKPNVVVAVAEPKPAEIPEVQAEATDAVGDADLVELAPTTPESSEDQTDTLAELADVEIQPDSLPEIQDNSVEVSAPTNVEASEVSVSAVAPVAPQAPPLEQETPNVEVLPEVSLDVPAPQPEPSAEPQPAPVTEAIPQPEPAPEPNTEVAALEEEVEENPFEDSPIAVEGDEDTAPRKLPRIASVPQIGAADEGAENRTVGTRVVPLTERDDAPETPTDTATPVALGKPIEAYAAVFDNPEAKPLMSIILIDDEGAFGAEALRDFPYPLSIAVSPSDPEAVEKMARHRDAGFEVLAMADLPEAASAQDAEVSLAVWLETLPETVGILEGVQSGIQGNRKLADQVAAIAAGTGRGLITQDNGLNTVQKLAARNGVPSGVIFRDIDGARQDPKIMRRFLDQAAFRAGQEGTVVMLGRLRPDTISALLLWGLEDRGGRVAMAPISAVMMKEVQ